MEPSAANVGVKVVVLLLLDERNGNPDVSVVALLLIAEELRVDDMFRLSKSTEPSSPGLKMYTVVLASASTVPCPEATAAGEPELRIVVGMYGNSDVSEAEAEARTASNIAIRMRATRLLSTKCWLRNADAA